MRLSYDPERRARQLRNENLDWRKLNLCMAAVAVLLCLLGFAR